MQIGSFKRSSSNGLYHKLKLELCSESVWLIICNFEFINVFFNLFLHFSFFDEKMHSFITHKKTQIKE